MSTHAKLSPSGSVRWLACANSVAAEADQPKDEGNAFAQAGTDRHELLEMVLKSSTFAGSHFGNLLESGNFVDDSMIDDVKIVVSGVSELIEQLENTGYDVEMLLEQRVPIGQITGEVGATGSADIILIARGDVGNELFVIDAKFGRVPVEAGHNSQMMMYALGALFKFDDMFYQVSLVIAQPAVSHEFSTWITTPNDLQEWRAHVATPAAKKARMIFMAKEPLASANYMPAAKVCKYCRAKPVCPAVMDVVKQTLLVDFDNLDVVPVPADMLSEYDLGDVYPHLDLIEGWVASVRARVLHTLTNGRQVAGLKLVAGKKGHRAWADPVEAERVIKAMRLTVDEMYKKTLLGPKSILEVVADKPRMVKKLEALISQKEGQPAVAPESSPKEAIIYTPPEDDFEVVIPADNSDLL